MKTKANQSTLATARHGAGITELDSEENRRISGGSDPAPTRYYSGPDSQGCIPPRVTIRIRGVLVSD